MDRASSQGGILWCIWSHQARANRRMLASSAPADHAGPSTLSNTDSNGEYIAGAKMNAFFEVHFVYLIPFF